MTDSYPCKFCGANGAEVKDSRPTGDEIGFMIRRRRRCKSCRASWTTYEVEEATFSAIRAAVKSLLLALPRRGRPPDGDTKGSRRYRTVAPRSRGLDGAPRAGP